MVSRITSILTLLLVLVKSLLNLHLAESLNSIGKVGKVFVTAPFSLNLGDL